MCRLSLHFRDGDGVGRDAKQAFAWAKRAADAGDAYGMVILGELYEEGEGIPKNPALASALWEKAAKAGSIAAMRKCANIALERMQKAVGNRDLAAAPRYAKSHEAWIEKASSAGDRDAALILGGLWRIGYPGAIFVDEEGSFRQYLQASDTELPKPLLNLACCFFAGWGCKANEVRADELLSRSLKAAERDEDSDLIESIKRILSEPTAERRGESLKEFLGWTEPKLHPAPGETPPPQTSSFSPPRMKRRYASQDAARDEVQSALGQGLQQALQADAAVAAQQRNQMSPQQVSSGSHYCGAPTLDGTPCRRLVAGLYGYWYQHRGY
jgi:TPR repeat protein